jgi:hypothetical protein
MGMGRLAAATLAGALFWVGCTGDGTSRSDPGGTHSSGGPGSGTTDGSATGATGTGTTSSSSSSGSGTTGAGTTGSVSSSGGTTASSAVTLHASAKPGPASGWQVLGSASGGPTMAHDVSADAAGNLWVAGGKEGLFLLPAGATTFRRFGLADGLHPYGFPPTGSVTQPDLDVISVAGGEAGQAYVGYRGVDGCEDEWDIHASNPDPNIYKSGDVDHVWLSGQGLGVAHYDIFTGPGVVASEPRGREKLCSVYRIVYDGAHGNVWIGANHGYAWLNPSYRGTPAYNGQDDSQVLREHAHPAISGYLTDSAPPADDFLLTGGYYGLAVAPGGDLWVGGIYRSYHCVGGNGGTGFWGCEADDNANKHHQLDIWPDAQPADAYPHQRVDDYITGFAPLADGTVWASARNRTDDWTTQQATGLGLAHLGPDGTVLGYLSEALLSPHLNALHTDPTDGTLWIGSEQGVMRFDPASGTMFQFGADALGSLATDVVTNIQVDTSGGGRRVLVSFYSGSIAIYSGN